MPEVITHATLVLRDECVAGSVVLDGDYIVDVQPGRSHLPGTRDWEGDYLLPGLVELHTDNLEKHMEPRPGVRWPALSAVLIHDAQIASSGITTVLDALFIGDLHEGSLRSEGHARALRAIEGAAQGGLLRAEHLLHLRCELASPNMMAAAEPLLLHPKTRLVSVMDHTPGQRQWRQLDKYREYTQRDDVWSDAQLHSEVRRLQDLQSLHAQTNRAAILRAAHDQGLPLASHDDTEPEHVQLARADGIRISEFPTTAAAARTARACGLATVVGAPNLVRGQSHSGNVSALDLAMERLIDCISSDYVPQSLLQSAMVLHRQAGWALHEALGAISLTPARLIALTDRGEIAPGQRADMVRMRLLDDIPVALETWRAGRRVA